MKLLNWLVLIFVLLTPNLSFPQETYTVDNFSNDFLGKIYLEEPGEALSKGWVAIVDKKTGKELIKVESDELLVTLHDGKALANIKELPYGEQSPIMYEDFNFDGVKDFAIVDGHRSCYGGPSFRIYLADGDKFTFSEEFTRLAHEYCGMFAVNAAEKKLSTMTKNGCCRHEYSEFTVENNKPKAVSVVVEDETALPFHIKSKETWNGDKMVKTTERTLDLEDIEPVVIFSFQIEKSGKRAILFSPYGTTLVYALLKENGVIEFSYPEDPKDPNSKFKFHSSQDKRSLTFGNGKATYTIYENTGNKTLGIKINVDGKTYDWKGAAETRNGDLDFPDAEFENVVVH